MLYNLRKKSQCLESLHLWAVTFMSVSLVVSLGVFPHLPPFLGFRAPHLFPCSSSLTIIVFVFSPGVKYKSYRELEQKKRSSLS